MVTAFSPDFSFTVVGKNQKYSPFWRYIFIKSFIFQNVLNDIVECKKVVPNQKLFQILMVQHYIFGHTQHNGNKTGFEILVSSSLLLHHN